MGSISFELRSSIVSVSNHNMDISIVIFYEYIKKYRWKFWQKL